MIRLPSGAVLDSYARESHVKKARRRRADRSSPSIDGQHAVNLSRVKEYGAALGEKLQDEGKSAWDPKVKRDGWEKALSRLESGASQGVVIFDVERLLRQVEDAVRIVKLAERGFLIIDSDGEYDLTSPSGRTSFYNAAVAAEGYSHRLSTRVKRGFNLKIQDGEALHGRWRMFGFEDDATTVREEEAEHIRRIAAELLAGRAQSVIVRELNELGLRTGSGGRWSHPSLRRLMINPKLAGHIQRHGEIVGRLSGEPILEPTIWQQVVQHYTQRSGRPATGAYLCSGIVVCGACGNTLTGSPDGRARPKGIYEPGEKSRRYLCHKFYGGCGKIIADQKVLDEHIEALVLDALSDPEHVDQIRRRAEREAKARAPIAAEIGRLEALQGYWDQRLNDGRITMERHGAMVADVEDKLAEQRLKLKAAGPALVEVAAEALNDARAKWKKADGTQRRELLKRVLTGFRVEVDPGSTHDTDLQRRIRRVPV